MLSIRVGLCILGLLAVCSAQTYVPDFLEFFHNLDNWGVVTDSGYSTLALFKNSTNNVYLTPNYYTGGNTLVLRAINDPYQGYRYSSGMVYSYLAFSQGSFINIRATVPKGNALWPSIRLFPLWSPYGSYPASGQFDIMDTLCTDGTLYSFLTFGSQTDAASAPEDITFYRSVDWTVPHNFGVEWQSSYIRFWFDAQVVNGQIQGTSYNMVTSAEWYSLDENGALYSYDAPFDWYFSVVLGLTVGGQVPCNSFKCCKNVSVPASMMIHFVQVWTMESSENN